MADATFSRHDTYSELRRKFDAAWPNLRIEMHIADVFYHKEGMNEVDDIGDFMVAGQPDRTFTISDETTVETAKELFTQNLGANKYSLAAQILGNYTDIWIYPAKSQTLADANDPFFLRPKDFTHSEFQRRFTEHWNNLSIEFFRLETGENGVQKPIKLAPDFELKELTGTGIHGLWRGTVIERKGVRSVIEVVTENYLHDYLYISDYKNFLEKDGVTFQIKNNKLGVYWNNISSLHKLIDFNNAV